MTKTSPPPPRAARRSGFTLVEIMIVVLIISVLLNIAAPALVSARDKGQAKSCIKNLSNIATAKEQWAMDTKKPANYATAPVWTDLQGYIRVSPAASATGPVCPTKGDPYNYQPLPIQPTCTYGGSTGNLHQL